MIYTGPVDEFFDYRYGKLPYRSLEFGFETRRSRRCFQAAPVMNYPEREPVHARHRVQVPDRAGAPEDERRVRVPAAPRAIRTIPVPRPENAALYREVPGAGRRARRTCTSSGGSATYKYYNMDQVVAQALTLYKKLAGLRRPQPVAHDRRNPCVTSSCGAVWSAPSTAWARRFSDQVGGTGHHDRPGDLDARRFDRHQNAALPGAVGADRAGRSASCRLGLGGRAAGAAARARHPADRGPGASRQRTAHDEPPRSGLSAPLR